MPSSSFFFAAFHAPFCRHGSTGRKENKGSGENAVLDGAGDIELINGRYDHAGRYYTEACKRSGVASPSGVKLSYAVLRLGRTAEAEKDVNEIISAFDTTGTHITEGLQIPYVLAQAYSIKRNTGKSVYWLQQAIALGYRDYRWTSVDPLVDNVRPDPEGVKTLAALKEQFASMRTRAINEDADR